MNLDTLTSLRLRNRLALEQEQAKATFWDRVAGFGMGAVAIGLWGLVMWLLS